MNKTVRLILFCIFVVLVIVGGLSVGRTAPTSQWGDIFTSDRQITFDMAYEIAEGFGEIRQSLPDPMVVVSEADLYAWAMEILPYFDLEEISIVTVPQELSFFFDPFQGDRAVSVLGVSDCATYVQLNVRTANPASVWFARKDGVFTLAHELAHMQQGVPVCRGDRAELVEPTAQLMALEVMSAMANQGNYTAFYSVVNEMYAISMATTHYLAETDDQTARYRELRRRFTTSVVSGAVYDKAMRQAAKNPARLERILYLYNYQVLEIMLFSPSEIVFLATPQDPDGNYMSLVLDDTYYLIAHIQEMANGYIATRD